MKLYELAQNYAEVQKMLEEEESDIDPEVIKMTLDAIEEEIAVKCENIAKMIRTLEAEEKAFKEEEERLFKKRKTIESRKEWLKKYVEEQLQKAGIEEVKGKIFTIALRPNPPSVEIIDEETFMTAGTKYLIPQPPKIDKRLLIEDLKNGINVPGAMLKQTKGLRIR